MQGFVEVETFIAPERTHYIGNKTQANRKQYGIKHHVTITIHADMGNNIQSMASEIYRNKGNLKIWYKGQMIIILSRTRIAKNNIFVVDVNDTLEVLKYLLTIKTQCADYTEEIV